MLGKYTLISTIIASMVLYILGDDHKRLITLERDFFNWRLDDRPEFASMIGHYRNSDRLERYGLNDIKLRYEKATSFMITMNGIEKKKLSKRDQVDYDVLMDMLQTYIDGYDWRDWNYLTPMTWLEGQQRDPYFFVESTPFDNRGDFENYIGRLTEMPRLFGEYIGLFREAIRLNRTMHMVSMSRVPEQIHYILNSTVEDSIYFLPFLDNLQQEYFQKTIANVERQDIIRRAKVATSSLFRSYTKLNKFMKEVYLKHTRPQVGIGTVNQGKDYYKACLKWYLSLDMTPEEIHKMGNDEIKRVKKEMHKIMDKQGYKGYKIRDYFENLESNKEMFFDTDAELINEYEVMIAERIEPHLSSLFHDPPGQPVKVEVMRSDGSRGRYIMGTIDGIRTGIFMVNTFRKWPKYTLISVAMHETNPGHHLQMSIAATADLPEFRKTKEFSDVYRVPFAIPSYTAYVEGWALYSEFLGLETGIYKDDYERMGYYDAEMYRACRMVADTGIHYFGWTKQQAVELFLEHTSETLEGIEVEVDRYITWPGQAVAYKVGELKIQELRKYAEETLGDHFDIRDFHKVVLENGGMPLNLLHDNVKEWVKNFHKVVEIEENEDDCACNKKTRCQRSLQNKAYQSKSNPKGNSASSNIFRNHSSWWSRNLIAYVLLVHCVLLSLTVSTNSLFWLPSSLLNL